jgi:PAS domain S-box-containing protein
MKKTKPLNRKTLKKSTQNKEAKIKKPYQESGSIYKKLVESSLQGIVIAQGIPPRLVYANPAITRILGYSSDELTSLTFKQTENLIHPDDRLTFFSRYKDRLEGKSIRPNYEIRGVRKDGSTVWLELSATGIEYNGEPAVLATYVDITERKLAEKTLGESEERYRTILENIEDGYFEVDIAGNFTFFNDSVRRMLGYSKDEMMGMGNHQYTDPQNRKKLFEAFNRVYRTGEPTKGFDWQIIRKDGTKRFGEVSISLIKDFRGQPIGFRGIARDITERKKAEEALAQSEERYRTLVEEGFDGIFIQRGFEIIFANRRLYEMLGYNEGELEGLDHWIVYHPDYQALTRERAQARMRGESVPPTYEVKFLRKDGSPFWGEIHAKVIRFLGEPGIQVWARDISERKQAEETLHAERERFRSLSENAPFGMAMIEKDGAFKYINPKFKELFGYELSDIPDGKTWFRKAYPDPDYRHQVISAWLDDLVSLKSGEKRPRAFTAKCKDGSEKIINFISVQSDTGENLLACEDITELKRAEEALRKSEEKSKKLANENSVIAEIGRIISSSLSTDEVYKQFGEEVHKVIPFDRILINIVNPEVTTFTTAYVMGVDVDGRPPGAVIPWHGSATQEVFHSKSSLLIQANDINELADRYPALSPHFQAGLRSFMAIPLFSKTNVIGVLQFQSIESHAYSEKDLRLAERVGYQIAGAIANAQLFTEHKEVEEALRKSEERYRTILESIQDGYFEVDLAGNCTFANDARCRSLGYTKEELIGMNNRQFEDKESVKKVYQAFNRVYRTGEPVKGLDEKVIRKDGTKAFSDISVSLIRDSEGKPIGFRGISRDITERKQAEEALRRSEESSRELAKENAIMAEIGWIISLTLNIDEVYEHFSEEVNKLIPFDRIAINILDSKKNTATVAYVTGVDVPDARKGNDIPLPGSANEEILRTRSSLLLQVADMDVFQHRFPGLLTTYQAGLRSMMSVPLFSKDQIIGVLHIRSFNPNAYSERDLRLAERVGHQIAGAIANAKLFKELMQAEEEKIAIQEQLRQSQKMEAIGGMAGGIAHDFNNLLTVIKGYAELSFLGLKEGDPLKGNIEEIQKASQRAAGLIRQLLAFSRRQMMEMRVLDLNVLLKDLDKMLRRVIGEDIDLVTMLTDDLGGVKTDPGQIEQVIMNLAVNARDAMPKGGKLTIETANLDLDEAYARAHIAVALGRYVMLSISDTGMGMTPDVKERIFEPFFTTKEKGRGTGLGLSTVYGIVKQSGGSIWVYSEPGQGTTFKIYLPRVDELPEEMRKKEIVEEIPRGSETILLVEDHGALRKLSVIILETQGYKILEAGDGNEALRLCGERKEPIHLILTDVVMPEMSGRELTDRLKSQYPETKVLYMSGYTDNAIVHHGVLDKGVNFIQKPFTPESLARKVREVLDR